MEQSKKIDDISTKKIYIIDLIFRFYDRRILFSRKIFRKEQDELLKVGTRIKISKVYDLDSSKNQ